MIVSTTPESSVERRTPRHYPAIDGLRAVAVLSVVLYHLRQSWLPGGFVGVDVFFVISGFVVSMSMAETRPSGLGDFALTFYARRVSRILPALVLCLGLTTLLACMLIPHAWLSAANARTGIAAYVGWSNVVLAGSANDYFSPRAEFNPFTHTWSLGIEEQFYVLFPFLFYAVVASSRGLVARRIAAHGLAVAVFVSLAISAVWTTTQPVGAFYLLPSRLWELGVGVLLFLHRERWVAVAERASSRMIAWVGWICAIGILVCLRFADVNHFPIPWAVPTVVCTAGLIMIAYARGNDGLRVLSSAPAVQIGRISYSLYLWHWPVLVLMRWTLGLENVLYALIALGLSVALAVASYVLVERPVRVFTHSRRLNRAIIVSAGVLTVAGGAFFTRTAFEHRARLSLSVTRDSDIWLPDADLTLTGVAKVCVLESRWEAFAGGDMQLHEPRRCQSPANAGRLFVAGDSHAGAYAAMLRLYGASAAREIRVFTKGGCSFLDLHTAMAEQSPDCRRFTDAVMHVLKDSMRSSDILFLPSLRIPRFRDQWGGVVKEIDAERAAKSRTLAVAEARGLLAVLGEHHVSTVFEAPKPVFRSPPFRCADWFNRSNPSCEAGFAVARAEIEDIREPVLGSMHALAGSIAGTSIWDPLPVLCPTDSCQAFRDRQPLFFDGDHLSSVGNALLFPSFAAYINREYAARTQ